MDASTRISRRHRPALLLGSPRLLATVVLAALAMACAPPEVDSAESEREIHTFLDSYLTAIEARDTAAIRAMYAEPGRFVWIEDAAVRYRDADGVLEGLSAFSPEMPMRTELSDTEVTLMAAGEAAHAWTTFTTTIGEGAESFSFGGAMSFVLERHDGGWRVVGGHVSSPTGR